ncbi:MAG: hypothetical protein AB1679_11045 [Actinomycetota bacterium]
MPILISPFWAAGTLPGPEPEGAAGVATPGEGFEVAPGALGGAGAGADPPLTAFEEPPVTGGFAVPPALRGCARDGAAFAPRRAVGPAASEPVGADGVTIPPVGAAAGASVAVVSAGAGTSSLAYPGEAFDDCPLLAEELVL